MRTLQRDASKLEKGQLRWPRSAYGAALLSKALSLGRPGGRGCFAGRPTMKGNMQQRGKILDADWLRANDVIYYDSYY